MLTLQEWVNEFGKGDDPQTELVKKLQSGEISASFARIDAPYMPLEIRNLGLSGSRWDDDDEIFSINGDLPRGYWLEANIDWVANTVSFKKRGMDTYFGRGPLAEYAIGIDPRITVADDCPSPAKKSISRDSICAERSPAQGALADSQPQTETAFKKLPESKKKELPARHGRWKVKFEAIIKSGPETGINEICQRMAKDTGANLGTIRKAIYDMKRNGHFDDSILRLWPKRNSG